MVETIIEDNSGSWAIDILDVRFGSCGPLSHAMTLRQLEPNFGDRFEGPSLTMICWSTKIKLPWEIFQDVRIGQPIIYINSLLS